MADLDWELYEALSRIEDLLQVIVNKLPELPELPELPDAPAPVHPRMQANGEPWDDRPGSLNLVVWEEFFP